MSCSLLLRTTRSLLPVLALYAGSARLARAQDFVRQTLMVANFRPTEDTGLARKVGDDVRSRVARQSNKKEVLVLDDADVEKILLRTGFNYTPGTYVDEVEVRLIGKLLRVDEVVFASVNGKKGAVSVTAQIVLARDWRQRQPLAPVRAATPALAAAALAEEVLRARAQMTGLRRCENAGSAGNWATATREAEQAIRAYPAATLARSCLMGVLMEAGADADSVRRAAEEILARDSVNILAAVARARALYTLNRTSDAAAAWARIVELRPDSLELGVVAVEELLRMNRPTPALSVARKLIATHGRESRVRRLQFRAQVALTQWKDAAALGDSLYREDAGFPVDSNYVLRFIESLRQSGETLGSLSNSAHAVKQFPGDSRIYTQYMQLLTSENAAALPRGLMRFPDVSELYVLSAKSARSAGKRMEAIRATAMAVRHDPSLTQGYLQLAELWIEEQHPDSALHWLARAPRSDAGAEMVRTYAMGRGGQLLRAAADTASAAQRMAISFFILADSIDSRDDSRSYVAASNLQLARNELVLASKSRGCDDARRADEALTTSSDALGRGVGEGSAADELKLGYDNIKAAVNSALKVLCKS
jgi:tetratricopeptide (TPR) repeat protein